MVIFHVNFVIYWTPWYWYYFTWSFYWQPTSNSVNWALCYFRGYFKGLKHIGKLSNILGFRVQPYLPMHPTDLTSKWFYRLLRQFPRLSGSPLSNWVVVQIHSERRWVVNTFLLWENCVIQTLRDYVAS